MRCWQEELLQSQRGALEKVAAVVAEMEVRERAREQVQGQEQGNKERFEVGRDPENSYHKLYQQAESVVMEHGSEDSHWDVGRQAHIVRVGHMVCMAVAVLVALVVADPSGADNDRRCKDTDYHEDCPAYCLDMERASNPEPATVQSEVVHNRFAGADSVVDVAAYTAYTSPAPHRRHFSSVTLLFSENP